MPFADSTTDKKLELGWARDDQEQFYQRLFLNLQQIDTQLHNQFACDPRGSFGLKLSVFGGVIDTDPTWTIVPIQTILLADNTVNFVERSLAGVLNLGAGNFSPPSAFIPIAEVTTRNGLIANKVDRRPELAGTPGANGGVVSFQEIAGQIFDGQVPLSAVKQWEASLSIAFTQLTGVAARSQLPAAIAYEDEPNDFGPFEQRIDNLNAPNFEALMRFVSHG